MRAVDAEARMAARKLYEQKLREAQAVSGKLGGLITMWCWLPCRPAKTG